MREARRSGIPARLFRSAECVGWGESVGIGSDRGDGYFAFAQTDKSTLTKVRISGYPNRPRQQMKIPSQYSETRTLKNSPATLAKASTAAIQKLKWKMTEESAKQFTGTIPMSFWSWGEEFKIAIDDKSAIHFHSVCRIPVTLIDWGKNQKNATNFFQALQVELGK